MKSGRFWLPDIWNRSYQPNTDGIPITLQMVCLQSLHTFLFDMTSQYLLPSYPILIKSLVALSSAVADEWKLTKKDSLHNDLTDAFFMVLSCYRITRRTKNQGAILHLLFLLHKVRVYLPYIIRYPT